MGTDIHAFVEVVGEEAVSLTEGEFYIGRDYHLFGALAGIRTAEPPLVPVRGIPQDPSRDVAGWYYQVAVEPDEVPRLRESGGTFGPCGFVTLQDAEVYVSRGCSHWRLPLPEPPIRRQISNPEWHSPTWLWFEEIQQVLAYRGLDVKSINPFFAAMYDAMLSLHRGLQTERVRLVFWFDGGPPAGVWPG